MSERLKPIGKRILVKVIDVEEKTAGGLYIPDNAKEKPQEAVVIEGFISDDICIDVGDTVIYGKYSGTEVTRNDVKYIILKIEDILAVVIKD